MDILLAAGEASSSVGVVFALLASFLRDSAYEPPVPLDFNGGGVADGLSLGGRDLLSVGDKDHKP